jgi:serine phosphatase RsbU (regulator of sigma subunit)
MVLSVGTILAKDLQWDFAQWTRLLLLLVTGIAAYFVAGVRIKERQELVTLSEVARLAQLAIIEPKPPQPLGVKVAVRYVSATEQALIGGDAYDAVETDYGLRVLVADARGKGMAAVRTASLALGQFRAWAHEVEDLGLLLTTLDRALSRDLDDADFVTALLAQLNGHQLTFTVAGHPPPLRCRNGHVEHLSISAIPPLGMIGNDIAPVIGHVTLMPGDTLMLYSDGLPEARDAKGNFYPLEDRVAQLIAPDLANLDGADRGLDAEIDRMLLDLRDFVHGDLNDDLVIVALRLDADANQPLDADANQPERSPAEYIQSLNRLGDGQRAPLTAD